eukprot:evm.model.scf_394.2 EVM.evm.TU.scf_394.2   scf_394:29544-33382(-)
MTEMVHALRMAHCLFDSTGQPGNWHSRQWARCVLELPRGQPCAVRRVLSVGMGEGGRMGGGRGSFACSTNAVRDTIADMLGLGKKTQAKGCHLYAQDMSYHPPGTALPLLEKVNLHVGANELALVYGSSGSGKTTLLQVLSGLCEATSGNIWICEEALDMPAGTGTNGARGPAPLPGTHPSSQRLQEVGMVFQFPERHFLGDSIRTELTFGWPMVQSEFQELLLRVQWALGAVGMMHIPVDTPTGQLSDGYKRRLALAVQLVRQPKVLLLDEPLAGLDWKARANMVSLLADLKRKCTLLLVSHDLDEIAPLADSSWEMEEGGMLTPMAIPNR